MDGQELVYSTYEWRVACVQGAIACLSCVTAATLISHIVYSSVCVLCRRKKVEGESSFLKGQMKLFIICMLVSDLFQSFSGIVQLRWASHGRIDGSSPVCRAQGIALMAGDLATGYFNVAIAIQTFMTIVARKTITPACSVLVIAGGWLYVLVLTLAGPVAIQDARGPFWGIAGLWCFIPDPYAGPRVWLHYCPIFTTAAIIVVMYGSVFWKLRQHTHRSGAVRTLSFRRRPANLLSDEDQARRLAQAQVNRIAYKLLWYPMSYMAIVMPISISRIAILNGVSVPAWYTNLGVSILFLSGFINGVIYISTRRALTPLSRTPARGPFIPLSLFKRGKEEGPATPTVYTVWVTRQEEQYNEPDSASTFALELRDNSDSKAKISPPKHESV